MKILEEFTEGGPELTLSITSATYIGDFAIRLVFSDGHEVLVDFKPFLENAKHPGIQKYLDESNFKEFKIVDGNLDWNDFDMCFPLEDLYTNSILKKKVPLKTL